METAPVLEPLEHEGFIWLAQKACAEAGSGLAAQYQANEPFPHIVLKNFLPAEVLRRVLATFPMHEQGRFADAQSNLKTGYQLEKITSPYINALINALNSAAFWIFWRS